MDFWVAQRPRHATSTANRPPDRPYASRGDAAPVVAPTQHVMRHAVGITAAVSFAIMTGLAALVVFSSLFVVPPQASITIPTPIPKPTAPPAPFNPSLNAPLPTDRIIAFYGYTFSDIDFNGPVSTHPFTFLPNLQQIGAAWTAADPTHPVRLGVDLVVDTWTGCGIGLPVECHALAPANLIQAYIDYCQQNNLLLFLDLQFGKGDVRAIVSQMLPYLDRYPFVNLALDTEFHFYPDQPNPSVFDLGHVDATDINWVIDQLGAIPATYHVPRKVLIIHQYIDGAISNRNLIKVSPLVSEVLHIDGFGAPQTKIDKYNELAQGLQIPYTGFKLFFSYSDCPMVTLSCGAEQPMMTPQQVLQLSPQPLIVTYQ